VARREVTGKKVAVTDGRARRKRGPPRPCPDNIRQHGDPNTTARTEATPIRGPPPVPAACFSIKTFCAAHHISEALYFKLRALRLGPDEMRIGTRVLISFEAAARWRAQREAATSAAE
jgi:hypothetical protein